MADPAVVANRLGRTLWRKQIISVNCDDVARLSKSGCSVTGPSPGASQLS